MASFCAHYVPDAFPAPRRRARRILLIGAGGQVGWELSRSLATLGDVFCSGRCGQPLFANLARPDTLRKVVREIEPALIVNAAAYTAVDKAESQRDEAMAANAAAPGVL